jgi:hypothetical protein
MRIGYEAGNTLRLNGDTKLRDIFLEIELKDSAVNNGKVVLGDLTLNEKKTYIRARGTYYVFQDGNYAFRDEQIAKIPLPLREKNPKCQILSCKRLHNAKIRED